MLSFKCKKCNEEKSSDQFSKHAGCKNGVDTGRCLSCKNKASKKAYHASSRSRKILNRAKSRATRKGLQFNITEDDLKIPEMCPIFGTPLTDESIDRMNPRLGYVKGNVNIISMRANVVKGNATLEELEAVVKWMKSKMCEIN